MKMLLSKWKPAVMVLQETKLEENDSSFSRQIWSNRWMDCVFLEASGTKGGNLIMWDKRSYKGELDQTGSYCITCHMTDLNNPFTWSIFGVYGPHGN